MNGRYGSGRNGSGAALEKHVCAVNPPGGFLGVELNFNVHWSRLLLRKAENLSQMLSKYKIYVVQHREVLLQSRSSRHKTPISCHENAIHPTRISIT